MDPSLRRNRELIKPILYSEELGTLPRDVLLDFLNICSKMMLLDENIDEVISDSLVKCNGLQNSAIEFQRDVLENNFQIERNFGCKYLSQLEIKHPGDLELIEAGKNFMYSAMKSYLKALKVRKEKNYKTIKNVPLNKVQILEFFEGCNALSKT